MAGFSKRRKFTANWTPDRRGVKHPSKGEAEWTNGLYDREERGDITDLELQPEFSIDLPNTRGELEHICKVRLDARFFDVEADRVRWLDYKGIEGDTRESQLKRTLVRVCCGIPAELAGPAKAKAIKKESKKAWAKLAAEQRRAEKKKARAPAK